MLKISSVYRTSDAIYRTGAGRDTSRSKNGDIRHIVFKDGEPVFSEVIRTRHDSEVEKRRSKKVLLRKREGSSSKRRSSEEVFQSKRKKLSDLLKKAIRQSLTLWSQKEGIWISYQGKRGFLVKLYTSANSLISSTLMSREEILDSSIHGLFDARWETC